MVSMEFYHLKRVCTIFIAFKGFFLTVIGVIAWNMKSIRQEHEEKVKVQVSSQKKTRKLEIGFIYNKNKTTA